jgi:hypothetical protein
MTDKNRSLIYIPGDGNYIEILGYKIDGFESFDAFCEYLYSYSELEDRCKRFGDLIRKFCPINSVLDSLDKGYLTDNDIRFILGFEEVK